MSTDTERTVKMTNINIHDSKIGDNGVIYIENCRKSVDKIYSGALGNKTTAHDDNFYLYYNFEEQIVNPIVCTDLLAAKVKHQNLKPGAFVFLFHKSSQL